MEQNPKQVQDGVFNPFLCPACGQLAVADLNVFPQSMWKADEQKWCCEQCQIPLVRTVRYGASPEETAWRVEKRYGITSNGVTSGTKHEVAEDGWAVCGARLRSVHPAESFENPHSVLHGLIRCRNCARKMPAE